MTPTTSRAAWRRSASRPITALQAIEREWIPHFEVALDGGWRNGQTDHDRLDLPGVQIAWSGSNARWGRAAAAGRGRLPGVRPRSRRRAVRDVRRAAGAVRARSPTRESAGSCNGPRATGSSLELGTTPTSFEVSNLVGGLRFRFDSESGALSVGIDRTAVEDSLLSYAGTVDPVSGRTWGGVIRDRAYLGGRVGDDAFTLYGAIAGLERRRASGGQQHGMARRRGLPASRRVGRGLGRARRRRGRGARLFGQPVALHARDTAATSARRNSCRSGRFSRWRGATTSAASASRAASPGRKSAKRAATFSRRMPHLQAASGDPRYPGDSRDGIGLRLAASMEWRVTARAVAGVRLEGVRGEDADEVRLQVYARRWDHSVTDPVQQPPVPLRVEPVLHPVLSRPQARDLRAATSPSRYCANRSPSSGWRRPYSTVASR